MSFGIALPSWIVEKENSVWVLGLYALVFMVAMPTVVGMWWYRSIRYTGDQVRSVLSWHPKDLTVFLQPVNMS